MMGFQFAAGRRQAAFNNFLMEAWRPSSAPAANVEMLILTGVILKISYSYLTFREWREGVTVFPSFCSIQRKISIYESEKRTEQAGVVEQNPNFNDSSWRTACR